ncbi:hypothetical protein PROFUN_07313 [Planoprotostelium fungivorum]|uniref:F-box domain-containing protein n=1 Tax=Planoprotostelium fungivorum TaxID=1890364 RepID=A0A2P6NM39_9EUKA|nr:hypothetical protein PROFUN_07313 [Planoprotostelium fungivorum]
MQQLPSDLWREVFSFLSTPDLCVPCFISSTLRDAAVSNLNTRFTDSIQWWKRRKQLPTYNQEIVKWWLSAIRQTSKGEVLEATSRDQLEIVELLGWDNAGLPLRDQLLLGKEVEILPKKVGWSPVDILTKAIIHESKRIITACHQREDITETLSGFGLKKLIRKDAFVREEENLEMIQWLSNERDIEGLPSVTWPPTTVSFLMYSKGNRFASRGHRDTLTWLFQRTTVDDILCSKLYSGAGEGGRLDMITWLEEREIPYDIAHLNLSSFTSSSSVFQWAVQTLRWQVMNYCRENRFGLPNVNVLSSIAITKPSFDAFQLAIDHGYITIDTLPVLYHRAYEYDQLGILKWLHERGVLCPRIAKQMMGFDNLGILQWLEDIGYSMDERYINRSTPPCFNKTDEVVYEALIEEVLYGICNVSSLEHLLQRKWKKSEGEVQMWFNREHKDITKKWLQHLWTYGISTSVAVKQ